MKSLVFLSLLVFSTTIMAESRPCAEDAKKFCSDHKGNKKEMMKCMKDHESELSAECKEKAANMKEKMKEKAKDLKENCAEDAKKICNNVKPGHGAILKCLKEHESELSPACKESMPSKK